MVGSADFSKFKEADAANYDVVIFDWASIYAQNNAVGGLQMPPAPRLSADYAKATILIGGIGGEVGRKRQLKINWL
jgi:hypothetical protein